MQIIKQDKAINIVGFGLRTTNDNGLCMETIPQHWQAFLEAGGIQQIPNRQSDDIYAVYTDFENEGVNNAGLYTLIIGAEVANFDEVPKQCVATVIPASKRAVFSVEDNRQDKVYDTWLTIWENHELQKTFTSEYEHYQVSGDINVYIGVA